MAPFFVNGLIGIFVGIFMKFKHKQCKNSSFFYICINFHFMFLQNLKFLLIDKKNTTAVGQIWQLVIYWLN